MMMIDTIVYYILLIYIRLFVYVCIINVNFLIDRTRSTLHNLMQCVIGVIF